MINSNFEMHFASGHYYDSVDGNKRPVEIQTVIFNGLAVAANTLAVTAVSGKRIRVVGGTVYSNGATSNLVFISASGGAVKRLICVPANTVATPNVPLVLHETDFTETNTGEGLYLTNSAVILILTINYIVYTPSAT